MTIVYPRAMPTDGVVNQDFEIQRVDFQAPEAGGRIGGVQAGFPLWSATWTLGDMYDDVSDQWRAWVASLRGSQRRFLGVDYRRPLPKRYASGFAGLTRASGGAFNGTASGWSQQIDAVGDARLSLTGLPVGFVLVLGDYIGFRWDAGGAAAGTFGRRTMARVTEGGIANGAGTITVIVEPPVPSFVQASVQAHLDNPACVMVIPTGGAKLGAVGLLDAIEGGTIMGVQDLRP